jgi:uncharacterized protein with HEPN domain
MTERSLSEVLQDILDAIADIEMFTAKVDFEAFRHNREKVLAVLPYDNGEPVVWE